MPSLTTKIVTFLLGVGFATTTNATLISRLGGQAVYDTDLDITWLADANLAASQTFGVSGVNGDGMMSWNTAHYEWLPAMNAHDGTGYLGFNDWRLPTTVQPDFGCSEAIVFDSSISSALYYRAYDCTGSEMGHLFYDELGGTGGQSIVDSGDPDLALFSNLESVGSQLGFWSEEFDILPEWAWYFSFDNVSTTSIDIAGYQNTGPKSFERWTAWVVRDGDVFTVPEPSTLGLLGAGLLGLGFLRRRRAV